MQYKATTTKEPQERLDSPATFARFAGVTPQCVRNWCHQGIIPTVIHAGRIIRFDRAAAIKALANETAGTAAGKGGA